MDHMVVVSMRGTSAIMRDFPLFKDTPALCDVYLHQEIDCILAPRTQRLGYGICILTWSWGVCAGTLTMSFASPSRQQIVFWRR